MTTTTSEVPNDDNTDRRVTLTTTPLRFRLIISATLNAFDGAEGEIVEEYRGALFDLMGRPSELEEVMPHG